MEEEESMRRNICNVDFSTKGKPKMVLDGYSYFQNTKSKDKIYWLCAKNRIQKCKARVITSLDYKNIRLKKQKHNH